MKRDWAALAFAMAFPSFLSWVCFFGLPADASAAGGLAVAAYGAGKAIQFAFPLVYTWLFDRGRLRLTAPTVRGLGLGVGFSALVVAGMFALYHFWLGRDPALRAVGEREITAQVLKFGLNTPARFVLFAAFIALVHSLFEEYYFRWFIFGRLRDHVRLWPAVVLSGAAFMAHHVIVMAAYFPGAFHFLTIVLPLSLGVGVGGAVWAWLYDRTGSLYAPWLSHLLIDVGIMVIGYDLVGHNLSGLPAPAP